MQVLGYFFLSSLCLQDEKPTPDPEGKEQTDQDDNKYKKDEKKLSTWHALSKLNSYRQII